VIGMLVLMAIRPRVYRDAIGNAIRGLRPHVEVVILDPDEVEDALACLDPDLVICDGSASPNADGRSAWVEYDPHEQPPATVSLDGQHTELEEVELEDLLSVIDEAEALSSRGRTDLRNR